jgi:Zn-dependent peptidase ImmA (M78 family)
MSLQSARSTAEKLAATHFCDRLPVRPEIIARKLGIAYLIEPLAEDIDGLLIVKGGRSTICVNKGKHDNRQRFSGAHELGHHVLGHYARSGNHVHVDKGVRILRRSPSSSEGTDLVEIEANQFAASLLMPSTAVRKEVEMLEILFDEDEIIDKLSKIFEVSIQAMTIRLTAMRLLQSH